MSAKAVTLGLVIRMLTPDKTSRSLAFRQGQGFPRTVRPCSHPFDLCLSNHALGSAGLCPDPVLWLMRSPRQDLHNHVGVRISPPWVSRDYQLPKLESVRHG